MKKTLAIVGAVALVGGYVFLGAAGGPFPGSKSGHISAERLREYQREEDAATASQEAPPTTSPRKSLMPGSKSAIVVDSDNLLFADAAPANAPTTQP